MFFPANAHLERSGLTNPKVFVSITIVAGFLEHIDTQGGTRREGCIAGSTKGGLP